MSKPAAAKTTVFPPSALAMSSDFVPKDWDVVIVHAHPESVLWPLLPFYHGLCAISYCSPATTKHRSVWADQLECVPSPASSSPFVNSMQHLSKSSTSTSDLVRTAPDTDLHSTMRCGIHSRQELQYLTPGLTPTHKITLGKPRHPSSPEFSQL